MDFQVVRAILGSLFFFYSPCIYLSIVFDLQVDELKVKSIFEFDEEFESIRELISPKTLLALDDEISSLQEAKRKLFQRLDSLLNKVSSSVCQYSEKVPNRASSLLEAPPLSH